MPFQLYVTCRLNFFGCLRMRAAKVHGRVWHLIGVYLPVACSVCLGCSSWAS